MAILQPRCGQVLLSEPNSSYGEGLLVPKGNPNNTHGYAHFVDTNYKVFIIVGTDQLDILNALVIPHEQLVTIANNADAISTVSTKRVAAYAATCATVAQLAKHGKRTEAANPFEDPELNGLPVASEALSFDWRMAPMLACTLALGLNIGAYAAEVVRGAMLAVSGTRGEVGLNLGLTPRQVLWRIRLPQGLLGMMPSLGNLATQNLKDTVLVQLFFCIAFCRIMASSCRPS